MKREERISLRIRELMEAESLKAQKEFLESKLEKVSSQLGYARWKSRTSYYPFKEEFETTVYMLKQERERLMRQRAEIGERISKLKTRYNYNL
jgi:hypothetical protein